MMSLTTATVKPTTVDESPPRLIIYHSFLTVGVTNWLQFSNEIAIIGTSEQIPLLYWREAFLFGLVVIEGLIHLVGLTEQRSKPTGKLPGGPDTLPVRPGLAAGRWPGRWDNGDGNGNQKVSRQGWEDHPVG
jgi:hypothetical protein